MKASRYWGLMLTNGRSMRIDDTRPAERGQARSYLAKALEFHETARVAVAADRWNAAGLSAIHAGLSAADAALVASAGLRSSSKDHGAAVALLRQLVPEAGAAQERQLTGLLAMKNTIAYEQRMLTQEEAKTLTTNAGRLVRWASGVVSSHLT